MKDKEENISIDRLKQACAELPTGERLKHTYVLALILPQRHCCVNSECIIRIDYIIRLLL